MKIIKETGVYKSYDGWKAETYVNHLGRTWHVHTFRGGRGIMCSAQAGELDEKDTAWQSFKFTMFQDPYKVLSQRKARTTEKTISEVHAEGLELFEKITSIEELQPDR